MGETTGPCGCELSFSKWPPAIGHITIIYCPTHAAAFENAERVEALRRAMLDGQRAASDAEGKVADLLAALGEVRAIAVEQNDKEQVDIIDAAIARTEEGESG